MKRRSPIFLLSFLIFHLHSLGQMKADTAFLAQVIHQKMEGYSQVMQGQSRLYNGSEYRAYEPIHDEHPYFAEDWIDGAILYDGELNENVPLLYDMSSDKIITEHYAGRQKIQLNSEMVEYFTLQDHLFVHLRDVRLRDGFYELIYDGASKVYVKKQKFPQENLSKGEIDRFFEEKTSYYLFKENSFYLVKSKKDVLRVFRDRRAELNQFIGKNQIRFKLNKEKSIARTAEYYDSIHH